MIDDYYAQLGVDRSASDEEIARAFRALAKQLHPDVTITAARPDNDRFTSVTHAYEVLSDPRQRYDYDEILALSTRDSEVFTVRGGRVPQPPAPPLIRWTNRRAIVAMVGGVVCLIAGMVMSAFMLILHQHEAADRASRQRARAAVIGTADGTPRLAFETSDGRRVTVTVPRRSNPGVVEPGDSMTVLYRPDRPRDVIVDETHFGRDFTLWFVAVKLLVCGPIISIVGMRKRRALGVRQRRALGARTT